MSYIGNSPDGILSRDGLDYQIFDGGQASYTLGREVASAASLFVFAGGTHQRPDVDYSVSGTTLNPIGGVWNAGTGGVLVFYVGAPNIVNAPGVGTVGTGQIVDDAVTFAKMQNITTARLLGRFSAGSGDIEQISLGSGLSLTGGVLDVAGSGVPAGAVVYFAMNTPPNGWLAANGAAVSRTTFTSLFAAIGTTYGAGDGSTTFNVPDLRGEFLRGHDGGRGVDSGRVFGSAQAGQVQNHTHTVNGQNSFIGDQNGDGSFDFWSGRASADDGNWFPMDSSGGGAETRPRNIALLACIKF